MAWVVLSTKIDIQNAKSILVGKTVKWRSPSRRRIAPDKYSDEYAGVAIFVLPAWTKPTDCPEVEKAKPSQCSGMGNGRNGESMNDRMVVRIDRTHAVTGKPLQPIYRAPRLNSIFAIEI